MNNVNIDEQSQISFRVQCFLKIAGLKINFKHGVDVTMFSMINALICGQFQRMFISQEGDENDLKNYTRSTY